MQSFPLDPRLEGRRLYLMRHGKTYEPVLDSLVASPEEDPELPLTADGVAAVETTARALSSLAFDAAWSSPYRRSHHTASIVAEHHALEVTRVAGLEELRVHLPGAATMLDIARRYIQIARELRECDPHEVELEPGVSIGAIAERATHALIECLTASSAKTVLVVAHGGINRLLLTQMLGMHLSRFLSIDQDFACVNVVEFLRRGRPSLRAVNLTVNDPFKSGDVGV